LTFDDAKQRRLDEETTAALVRERDRDRYWSALFAEGPNRPGLLALYAFNAELDHILTLVSEPMAGQIRLQWWRDAVDLATPGSRTGNPVADALSAAIIQHNLPKDRLLGMVDARVPAMFDDPPPDDIALKVSLRETEGAVFELAAAILGDRSASAKEAAAHAGVAYGLTGTLLKLPFLASRHKAVLPSSYLESRRTDLAAIHRGETSESFRAGLADLRGVASRALQRFRAKETDLDPSAWPAFLPLTLVKPYLRAMAAPDFDPLHTAVAISPLRRFWRIWRAARRRTL
jgi:15-cis-phytoene synthase